MHVACVNKIKIKKPASCMLQRNGLQGYSNATSIGVMQRPVFLLVAELQELKNLKMTNVNIIV